MGGLRVLAVAALLFGSYPLPSAFSQVQLTVTLNLDRVIELVVYAFRTTDEDRHRSAIQSVSRLAALFSELSALKRDFVREGTRLLSPSESIRNRERLVSRLNQKLNRKAVVLRRISNELDRLDVEWQVHHLEFMEQVRLIHYGKFGIFEDVREELRGYGWYDERRLYEVLDVFHDEAKKLGAIARDLARIVRDEREREADRPNWSSE